MATAKKKKRRNGPKWTKLTPEVEETILRHLRTGAFRKHAAEAAGVTEFAFDDWMRRGGEGEKPFAAFVEKVRRVQAEDAIRSQSIITRAQLGHIEGDWKAASWNLERKYPKLYGQAAIHAAAAVTLRGGHAATGEDNTETTTVQFYLPDNSRRPQDDED